MKRPSYKKLYLQEKSRREFYERIKPELLEKWELLQRTRQGFAADMEAAILATPVNIEPQAKMKGLLGFMTTM